ncbi:Hypothetical protein FKW44_017259 [Caligus rogercresseyi]|uniref:Uncharacterized protein n=1 Tax=Caligus rogercresseyi TaxID=217165 RepID=A0A7T8H356_CALRO|nr:Hypothetical protein FKW44_017259 [Caligus rogercresseyi]
MSVFLQVIQRNFNKWCHRYRNDQKMKHTRSQNPSNTDIKIPNFLSKPIPGMDHFSLI